MKIFENYNSAKQKYGENLVRELTDKGVPPQYLLAACRFVQEGFSVDNIKKYIGNYIPVVPRLLKLSPSVTLLHHQKTKN